MVDRNERVILSLVDRGFSTGMAKAAGQAAALERILDDLDGTHVDLGESAARAADGIDDLGESAKKAAPEVDGLGDETEGLGDKTQKTTKKTKELTLELAVAAERANRLRASLREQARALLDAEQGIGQVTEELDRNNDSVDRGVNVLDNYSSRLGLFVKTGLALGPALAPIGAVAVPAVTGLASQLGFAAVAAGTAVLAFQGVGDALEAVNKAALEPSTENLHAAQAALQALSPAAQSFVSQLQSMKPLLESLRDSAAEGMFPGLVSGLQSLEQIAPQVERVISSVSGALGDLFAAAGNDLASGRWDDFFRMLARDAAPTLSSMGSAIGSVVHGLSEMWEAFAPLNKSFGTWLADAAKGFDKWATGLKKTEGFEEFISYIRENGPVVAEAAMAIGDAIVQIVQAAAPLGGPVLNAVTELAEALAAILDSPLGTPLIAIAGAMSAFSLATNIATASVARLNVAMGNLGKGSVLTGASSNALGASLAAITAGVLNLADGFEKGAEGERTFAEGLTRSIIPGIHSMELLGVETGDVITLMEDLGIASQGALDTFAFFGIKKGYTPLGDWSEDALGAALATNVFADAAGNLNHPLQIAKASLRDMRAEARETAGAFFDLGTSLGPKKFDLNEWIDQLAQQAQALRNFRLNAERAAERGLDQGLIKSLQKLGPEGKIQLAALANASQREINRANEAWRSGQREHRKYVNSIDNVKSALSSLGQSSRASLNALASATGAPKAALRALGTEAGAAKADLEALGRTHPKPKITVTSNAQSVAAATNAALNSIADETVVINVKRAGFAGFASGGFTGDVDPRKAVGVVHGREVVIPEPVVRSDAAFLKSRYGFLPGMENLRGYASGGLVGEDHYWVPGDRNGVNSPHNGLGGDGDYDGPYNLTPDPHGGFGIDGLRKQLGLMRDEVRDTNKALRGMNREVRQSERAMEKQERVLDKATEAYEKQVNVVEQVQQNFDALAENVSGRLTSGIFSGLENQPESSSPWAAPVQTDIFGSIMGTLGADTNAGRAWDKARDTIDDFIEGPALQALLEQANVEQLTALAGLSGGQLDQIETAINLRDSVVGQAGAGSADAIFGAELRTQTALMSQSHAAQLEELAEFKAYREDWKAAVKREREADREKAILERQLQMLERELERARAERKGARDGKG